MRVLVCSVEAPLPPTNGFRLALGALTEALRRRGHELQLVGLRLPEQEGVVEPWQRLVPAPPAGRLRSVARLARATALRRPFTADSLAAALRGPAEEELERFRPDVVHVTSGRLAALGPALAARPSVLAALDAWHLNVEAEAETAQGLRRRVLLAEAARVRRFEAEEYRRFSRVTVVSDADAEALTGLDPSLRVDVIPNGVDAGAFAPRGATGPRDEQRLVFTGVMSWAPNVLTAEFLARRVFPLVRRVRPAARLAIVGREPARKVRELAGLEGVSVTGEVPDVRDWLVTSRAYACPMVSGTGIKNKLLEAMACALPCVATPLAVQGLRVEPGVHLLVGEHEDELAGHLVRLLSDDEEARRLGLAARDYVRAEHDWDAVGSAYCGLYEEAVEEAR